MFTDRADDAEIDVRTTRDGTVVVIHDGDLQDGKAVHVWTVNRIDAMECAAERGAANLITDQPAEALALRLQRARMAVPERLALRLRRLPVD